MQNVITCLSSAASLSVHIGSMTDPWEMQGLAHFLEHMLFMGTKKVSVVFSTDLLFSFINFSFHLRTNIPNFFPNMEDHQMPTLRIRQQIFTLMLLLTFLNLV